MKGQTASERRDTLIDKIRVIFDEKTKERSSEQKEILIDAMATTFNNNRRPVLFRAQDANRMHKE